MKNSSCLSYNFSMTFNQDKLITELQKDTNPYVIGIICGILSGRDLFLPNSVINLISLIKSLIDTYGIKLEDEDWFLFVTGLLKCLDLWGLERGWAVEWIVLEPEEVLPDESKIILISNIDGQKKYLCVTLLDKE